MQLTYKNKQTFRTGLGGLASILSKVGVLIYFILLLIQVLNRDQAKVTNTQFSTNLFESYDGIQLTRENFDIGFHVDFLGGGLGDALNIYSYVSIKI